MSNTFDSAEYLFSVKLRPHWYCQFTFHPFFILFFLFVLLLCNIIQSEFLCVRKTDIRGMWWPGSHGSGPWGVTECPGINTTRGWSMYSAKVCVNVLDRLDMKILSKVLNSSTQDGIYIILYKSWRVEIAVTYIFYIALTFNLWFSHQ